MFRKITTAAVVALSLAPVGAIAQAAFTTAAEVQPILEMTKGSWVAVREYEGNDLLYFTHLESWRCGLDGVMYGINSDVADQVWEQETCYEDEAAPNTMKMEDGLPFITLELGSVETVIVEITYDDGTTDSETFERKAIMTP